MGGWLTCMGPVVSDYSVPLCRHFPDDDYDCVRCRQQADKAFYMMADHEYELALEREYA